MSKDAAISIEGLSKRYAICGPRHHGDGLRHRLESAVTNPFRRLRDALTANGVHPKRNSTGAVGRRPVREDFWALKDISFDVQQGDTVAIIGNNGAGKSTLLKILSRITEPTKGRIRLNGRVASLLEVGTGFHQELTGRENIFLNGAILGMTRAEIRTKFDEIVAFSEIEQFLDTPVKRYSSGMYVRLAFAVAAHLEPEILIVDEVLAVGDASFQKKCLGKMEHVARGGRTILFVSHNIPAVQALCKKAVLLQRGELQAVGDVGPVINTYLSSTKFHNACPSSHPIKLREGLRLVAFHVNPDPVETGSPLHFHIALRADSDVRIRELAIIIASPQGSRVGIVDLRSVGFPIALRSFQKWSVNGTINSLPLVEGDYDMGLYVDASDGAENVPDLFRFTVRSRPKSNSFAPYAAPYRGVVELDFHASVSLLTQTDPIEIQNSPLAGLEVG